jgi:hypothetical protein
MSTLTMSGMAATLALAGMLPVSPAATALDAQEYANIQSHCRQEAQDYGIAPEQFEEYVSGCVLSSGGMPEVTPEAEAPPVNADVPAAGEQDTGDAGKQHSGAVVE